jgi:uncharacterized protein YycO
MRAIAFILLLTTTACGPTILLKKPPVEQRAKQNVVWLEDLRHVARDGDWLVTRGYKAVDNLVVAATNIPLSHAAIYDYDNQQVIEAAGAGVHTTPLATFIDGAHRVLVIRPRWWTPERGTQAVSFALEAIGKGYDFLGTVGGGSSDRYYCSELCIAAYGEHQVEKDHLPRVMEPGQMYLWGRVIHDTGPRY